MKIKNNFKDIEKQIKANKKFEKQIDRVIRLIVNKSSQRKLLSDIVKLAINESEYKNRIIDINLINEIKSNYYINQNLKFVNNIFEDFKTVKANLELIVKTEVQEKNFNNKTMTNLPELNLLSQQLSFFLKYIFSLETTTSSYNDIKSIKNYINEIMTEKNLSSIFTTNVLTNNFTAKDILRFYEDFINNVDNKKKDFINTYFCIETSENDQENQIVSELKNQYLNLCQTKMKELSPKWLSVENNFLEKILFLKEINPLFNKINHANKEYGKNYPKNPIKQCDRLIKKLENDYKFKLKINKLCKKYNITKEFNEIIDSKLLNTNEKEIEKNIDNFYTYKRIIKKSDSKIRNNKWKISLIKFVIEKLGIFKNTLNNQITSYINENKKWDYKRTDVLQEMEYKTQQLLPNCIQIAESSDFSKEIVVVTSAQQVVINSKELQQECAKAEQQPNNNSKQSLVTSF